MAHPLGNGHVVDAFEGQQTSGKEDKKLTSQPLQVGRKSAGAKRLLASDDLVLLGEKLHSEMNPIKVTTGNRQVARMG